MAESIEGRLLLAAVPTGGHRDPSFGYAGTALLSLPGVTWTDTAWQSDGKIVVVGYRPTGIFPDASADGILARLNPDGSADTAWGDGGVALYGDKVRWGMQSFVGLALQADGAIVVSDTGNAGRRTALAADDVFYFGHLLGDGADPASPGAVRGADVLRTRLAMNHGPAAITNGADVNKDGKVNALDLASVRRSAGAFLAPVVPPPPRPGVAIANGLDDLLH